MIKWKRFTDSKDHFECRIQSWNCSTSTGFITNDFFFTNFCSKSNKKIVGFSWFSFNFGWFGRSWRVQKTGSCEKNLTKNLHLKLHNFFRHHRPCFTPLWIVRLCSFVGFLRKTRGSAWFTFRDISLLSTQGQNFFRSSQAIYQTIKKEMLEYTLAYRIIFDNLMI